MKTFRDYEELIRNKVNEINGKDPNWSWSVKSLGKYIVRIRWGYLDYCEEKDNCFIMRLAQYDEAYNEQLLTVRTPQDDMIQGYIVSDTCEKFWQESFESSIKKAISEIAYYAHSRY